MYMCTSVLTVIQTEKKFSIIRTVVGKKSSKKNPTLTLDIWMGEWEIMKF